MTNPIKQLRDDHDLTQQQLADLIGTTRVYVAKLEGKSRGKLSIHEWLAKAGRALNVPIDKYLVGEDYHLSSEDLAAGLDYDPSSFDQAQPPFVNAIAQISGHIGAGNTGEIITLQAGELRTIEPVSGWWHVPPVALRTFGVSSPATIAAWPNAGDSMEPTIWRTDIVFIDTSRTQIEPDGIWAVDYGQGRTLKRIRVAKKDGNVVWTLTSDNDRYAPLEFTPDEVTVFGRFHFRCTLF
jgi:transcriptional regulator with XRE-family HTH domain